MSDFSTLRVVVLLYGQELYRGIFSFRQLRFALNELEISDILLISMCISIQNASSTPKSSRSSAVIESREEEVQTDMDDSLFIVSSPSHFIDL